MKCKANQPKKHLLLKFLIIVYIFILNLQINAYYNFINLLKKKKIPKEYYQKELFQYNYKMKPIMEILFIIFWLALLVL